VQKLISMSPSFGMDDEAYAKLLTRAMGVMKALRLK
jgi:succinate-semialdehyde dehydrogenase/glutarate-semialdehyde dehydrogenase